MADQVLDSDTDLLTLIEIDEDIPCDGVDCPNPARWSLTCLSCRHTILLCEEHRVECDIASIDSHIVCMGCDSVYPEPLAFVKI